MDTPSNLPRPLTSFVGRQRDVHRLRGLVARHRVITVLGPGGIGKSRVALEVAQRSLGAFPDGVWHVELSASDPHRSVDAAIADILGVRETAGAAQAVARALGDGRVLLVLDECEGSPENAARVVADLVGTCRAVHVIATSRQLLGLGGEVCYRLPTLGLNPGVSSVLDLERQEAIALFLDRLRAHQPSFRLDDRSAPFVREICRSLDGLPLAIELAAARARHFTLEELVDRLADQPGLLRGGPRTAPARQRSLQATVGWSLEALESDARRLFPALSVFDGGFDIAAADAVRGRRGRDPMTELIGELVDNSLVVASPGVRGATRYRLLEPIRQHAAAVLASTRRGPAVRERHARHYADRLHREARLAASGSDPRWLDAVDVDLDNLRAALEWGMAHDPAMALGLATDLTMFWCRRGYFAEGRRWLERALSAAPDGPAAAAAEVCLAMMQVASGDEASSRRLVDCALPRLADDEALLHARALVFRAVLASGDREQVVAALDEAAAVARREGSVALACEVLGASAECRWLLGDEPLALRQASEAMAMARRLELPGLFVVAGTIVAREATYAGRPEADDLWGECLEASRELDDPVLVILCLAFEGIRAAARNEPAVAADRLREEGQIARRIGAAAEQLHHIENVGVLLVSVGRSREGLRLIWTKAALLGDDRLDSPSWRRYLAPIVEEAVLALGGDANRIREEIAGVTLDAAMAEADRELMRLTNESRATRREAAALSRRELEIAHLTATGLTNREIGQRLAISERTAEAHIHHILTKLSFANRAQLAAWVIARRSEPPFDEGHEPNAGDGARSPYVIPPMRPETRPT